MNADQPDSEIISEAVQLMLDCPVIDIGRDEATVLIERALETASPIPGPVPQSSELSEAHVYLGPGGRGGGYSLKLSNLLRSPLELTHLALGGVVWRALSVAQREDRWSLAALALVIVLTKLHGNARIDLDERKASVLWTMRPRRGLIHRQAGDELLARVNEHRRSIQRGELSELELEDTLVELEDMGCVSSSKHGWALEERVSIR